MKLKAVLQKAGLVIFSILLSLLLAEFVLRFIYPSTTRYYVWQPLLRHTFYPDTSLLPGLSPVSEFTINAYGIRGIESVKDPQLFKAEKNDDRYYLCLGGSTTECLYLDDKKSWPSQLWVAANQDSDFRVRYVGNIGKSGCTLREHYIQMKYC